MLRQFEFYNGVQLSNRLWYPNVGDEEVNAGRCHYRRTQPEIPFLALPAIIVSGQKRYHVVLRQLAKAHDLAGAFK